MDHDETHYLAWQALRHNGSRRLVKLPPGTGLVAASPAITAAYHLNIDMDAVHRHAARLRIGNESAASREEGTEET